MWSAIRHYTHLTSDEWACVTDAAEAGADPRRCGAGRWTSWSLVDFRYRRHDTVGYLFAISSFLPIVVVVFVAGVASAPAPQTRVPALVLLLCLMGSTALNTCLKAVIRSPRPPHPAAGSENYSTVHGMPSDHTQFIAFFTMYLTIRASLRTGLRRPPPPLSLAMRLFFVVAVAVVAAGRVYNGYHTVEQVSVGAALGVALAYGCTRRAAQRALTAVAEAVMVPLMLLCTSWTCYIS